MELVQNIELAIIDIGCGNTELLKKIKKLKNELSQNDISYTGAGFEISSDCKDIEIIQDLDLLSSTGQKNINNSFDYILILDVIEHLENPYSFLKQLKNIASRECKVLISIPNIQSYRSRLKFLFTGKPSSFFPRSFYFLQHVILIIIYGCQLLN